MLIAQLNASDAEKVFGAFTNKSGASMAVDSVVMLDIVTTVDGNAVIVPTTAGLNAVVGIANAAIADTAVGLVQLYGYRASSIFLKSTVSNAAGIVLTPVNAQAYLSSGTQPSSVGLSPMFVLLESVASSAATATVSAKIHIRCM